MFQNEILAGNEAKKAYSRALERGMTEDGAERISKRVYREELARLDKWVSEHVGLN